MLLPTKHMSPDRCLLAIGAELLDLMRRPITVSSLWDKIRKGREASHRVPIGYEWFVLAIDMLYVTDAITYDEGLLRRAK